MARNKKALGDNPLFNPVPEPKEIVSAGAVTEETVKQAEAVYKNLKKAYLKEKAKKQNQESEYTRMTFIIHRDQLQELREYAKREGISVKESLARALRKFFETEE